MIALGVWLFWHDDGRSARRAHRGKRHRQEHSRPWAGHQQQPHGKGIAGAAASRPLRQPELPIDMQVKVEQIRRKVDVLLTECATRRNEYAHADWIGMKLGGYVRVKSQSKRTGIMFSTVVRS